LSYQVLQGIAMWPDSPFCQASAYSHFARILLHVLWIKEAAIWEPIMLKYEQGGLTNRCWVSSNYTTYILVSPSCNIPTNNILISSVASHRLA